MPLLSANLIAGNKTLIPSNPHLIKPSRNPRSPLKSTPPPSQNPSFRLRISLSAATTTADVQIEQKKSQESIPAIAGWVEFASRISGEWDGFGAEFTVEGKPVELPEAVVPEAFREWEVKVFDWQTQCPTLAVETVKPMISYKLIKLLPTVGCEADAATRHSVDERIAGGEENMASAFGHHPNGCYIAVWPVEGRGGLRLLEIEHCIVDPTNREARVRVIQVLRLGEGDTKLERIEVFSEQWYGPFRNGEQLGGCSIRESGFASSDAVKESEVVGVWNGTSSAVASFAGEQSDIFRELVTDNRPQQSVRDQAGLVLLPKQLWCSFKEEEGEIQAEIGWLIDSRSSLTSRCAFLKNGRLKEMSISEETAVLEGM